MTDVDALASLMQLTRLMRDSSQHIVQMTAVLEKNTKRIDMLEESILVLASKLVPETVQ